MQRVGERADLPALRLDERHHILAVRQERSIRRPAQRHVQRGTVLRVVDRMTGEHELDPALYFRLLRELEQELERTPVEELAADRQQALGARDRSSALRLRHEQLGNGASWSVECHARARHAAVRGP
jgi:hypothetical protein